MSIYSPSLIFWQLGHSVVFFFLHFFFVQKSACFKKPLIGKQPTGTRSTNIYTSTHVAVNNIR